jgi:hypothetical protein
MSFAVTPNGNAPSPVTRMFFTGRWRSASMSMAAPASTLRAAELHSFGMGRIFESKERSGSEICALRPASHQ